MEEIKDATRCGERFVIENEQQQIPRCQQWRIQDFDWGEALSCWQPHPLPHEGKWKGQGGYLIMRWVGVGQNLIAPPPVSAPGVKT